MKNHSKWWHFDLSDLLMDNFTFCLRDQWFSIAFLYSKSWTLLTFSLGGAPTKADGKRKERKIIEKLGKEVFTDNVSILLYSFTPEVDTHCSRPLSRIVRNQLREHFFSVFESKHQEPHSKCPLQTSLDLYSIQEGSKIQEYTSKWVCNFCGKAFLSELYLDKHFDNRHSDKLVKGTTICLADFCDIFRCEVFDNQRKDYFWEKKLCKESRMMVRKRRCQALMRSCLPNGNLSAEQELEIYEAIGANTCSLLNCKDYWRHSVERIPAWKIIIYAVVTPFFFMGLIVYYYAISDYYFGDYPVETHRSREEEERFSPPDNFRASDLRRRYGGRPLMY